MRRTKPVVITRIYPPQNDQTKPNVPKRQYSKAGFKEIFLNLLKAKEEKRP